MMPLDYKMRKTLLRYAKNLDEDRVDKLDSFITEKFQVRQVSALKIEPFHFQKNTGLRTQLIASITATVQKDEEKINNFINEYERQYYAAHKILVAQRSYALHQRHMLQIPTTFPSLWQFIRQSFYFRMIYTWFNMELWAYWFKDLLWPKKK